jgi:hypothetical protein
MRALQTINASKPKETNMSKFITGLLFALSGVLLLCNASWSASTKCPSDSVQVGPLCVDKYEASVWETSSTNVIKIIKNGHATAALLNGGGALHRGDGVDNYPCDNNGQDCSTIYAVSLAGVNPSRNITWFQAQQACLNSGKRLLSNAEWQGAAAGTPDPGSADDGTTECNVSTAGTIVPAGSRSVCRSRFGVFDMIGNATEWVADWGTVATTCPSDTGGSLFNDDLNCTASPSTTAGPAALNRGGPFFGFETSGVFSIDSTGKPTASTLAIGFRCGR